jgi:membrane associated rhomboid family serine protease
MSISITLIILGITGVVSFMAFNNQQLLSNMMLNPYSVKHRNQWYRIFSHIFVHADWMHLLFNAYTFWSFGSFMEKVFTNELYFAKFFPSMTYWGETKGILAYVLLYLTGGVMAALPALRKHSDNVNYNAVGASGAVSAVMMAFMIMFPTFEIAFFAFISMPAFVGAIVFLGLEHYLSRRGNTNIAHDAHIWGALFGAIFVGVLNPQFYVNFVVQVQDYIVGLFG